MKKLRPYQVDASNFCLDRKFAQLDIDCGLGKTLIACDVARRKKEAGRISSTLVIAPKAITEQWKEELMETGVDEKDIFVFDRPTATKLGDEYTKQFLAWLEA